MVVDQPTPSREETVLDPSPEVIDFTEYSRSDMSLAAAADFWDSLDDASKEEFLTVPASDLAKFAGGLVQEPWLVDFISDVIAFLELHDTWELYVCPDPDCSRLFQNDESLIIHLKCEHFPEIHPVAWPPRRRNLAEERWCADDLRKMVWKLIVVEAALDMLSSMCLNYRHVTMADVCSGSDRLYSLNWLYSEDPKRKRLLVVLQNKFQHLLAEHKRASFSLLSDGFLRRMTALASKHIFVGRPPRYNTQFLQGLLACSPLSFCLLEAADLERFVELVEPMCQFVQQATLPSANRESEFREGDKIESLDIVSFSPSKSLFALSKADPLCDGERVSMPTLLCRAPCVPTILRVPTKAKESFSCVEKVLNELRECQITAGPTHQNLVPLDNPPDSLSPFMGENFNSCWTIQPQGSPYFIFSFGDPVKVDCIESHCKSEQNHLQLINRVLCLESQLCELCSLDCRMYILPLMKSLLRLKLYFYLRCRRLKNPAEQCRILYQEECTEQQVSSEVSDSDSDLDDKPLWGNPILCTLDSTFRESATGETEGSGPFFWVAVADVLRHCEEGQHGVDESVRDGIRWFRLNKTWKYWLCYCCDRKFIDRESHMMHMENKHQLSIGGYWLIPQQDSRYMGEEFKHYEVKRESGLEGAITLDDTCDHFLVDSAGFYQMPSSDEEEELVEAKHRQHCEIVRRLRNRLGCLSWLFQFKCHYLTYLQVVDALGLMLFRGGQPLSLLVIWLHKLSTVDWPIGSTHHLQFLFLSRLLSRAHSECYGPLSNCSVIQAFGDLKYNLITELQRNDWQILEAVDKIDNMKHYLSNLCVCDYSTKPVRSFLHVKFNFDYIRWLKYYIVKEVRSSLKQWLVQSPGYSFKMAAVLSPGKVVINTMENKLSWAFAFIGIRLRFEGVWSLTGSRLLTGVLKFRGWFSWNGKSHGNSGSVIPEDPGVMESIDWLRLNQMLCDAVSYKLVAVARLYGEHFHCHAVRVGAD